MEKSTEEKFFEEVSIAMQDNNTKSMDILLEEDKAEDEDVLEPEIEEEEIAPEEEEESDTTLEEEDEETPPAEPAKELTEVESLRKQLEDAKQVEHKLKSDAGRVPSLQRKLAELDKKLADISANPTKSGDASKPDAPTFALNSAAMNALKASDPELAQAIEDSIAAAYGAMQKDSIERTREVTNTFLESAREESFATEWDKLTVQVPNAKEVFTSNEWKAWREQQTPGVRALADSDFADDVVMALHIYAGHSIDQPRGPAPPSKITEARDKRLQTKTPTSGSKGPAPRGKETGESLFNKIYQETINLHKRR